MENYRTSSHNRFGIKYHFVWITKYRKSVLRGTVAYRRRELSREVCQADEIEILQGHVSANHALACLRFAYATQKWDVTAFLADVGISRLRLEEYFLSVQKP